METNNDETAVATMPAVIFEAVLLDEKEPVKLTPALIREKSKVLTDLKIENIFDEAGYKTVKSAVTKAVKTRTTIEKEEKRQLGIIKTDFETKKKELTDYTAGLYEACREAQTTLENKLKVVDDERQAAAKKLDDAKREKTEGRENKIFELGLTWNGQAFGGYGKTFTKEMLHEYSDDYYNNLVIELEGLQMEQSVTGKENIGAVTIPMGKFTDRANSDGPQAPVYGYLNTSQPDNRINVKEKYPTAVYIREVTECGIQIFITRGEIEAPESGAMVLNERILESAYYVQAIR